MPCVHWHCKMSKTPESSCAEFSGHGVHGALRDPGIATSCQVEAGQGTHADMPSLRATVPAAHAVHALLAGASTAAENLPAGHRVHCEAL